jgi:hypothetical protein
MARMPIHAMKLHEWGTLRMVLVDAFGVAEFRGVEAAVGESAEGGFELAFHFFGGSGDGLLRVRGDTGDDHGLKAPDAGFELTAFVVDAGFGGVFVAEMDFDACELVAKSSQYAVQFGFDKVGEFVMDDHVFVAVDLNLH